MYKVNTIESGKIIKCILYIIHPIDVNIEVPIRHFAFNVHNVAAFDNVLVDVHGFHLLTKS